jgi:cell division protein FtsN
MALLRSAVLSAQPAFATQEDALRSGAYTAATAPPLVAGRTSNAAATQEPARVRYGIQIAAYRDRLTAEAVAASAARQFPEAEVVLEGTGEFSRVLLVGWVGENEVFRALAYVRQRYPDAWVRRAVP